VISEQVLHKNKLDELQKKEEQITNDIIKDLNSISSLTSQHLQENYSVPKESTDQDRFQDPKNKYLLGQESKNKYLLAQEAKDRFLSTQDEGSKDNYLSAQEAKQKFLSSEIKPKEPSVERNFELRKSAKKVDIKDTTESVEKLHTLKYSSGGVLSNKSAQTHTKETDLPFIDEDELELDEAIQDATGLAQDQQVQSIQLNSTANASSVQGLLISQRSCSGTDTIHISEKVIQRDYRDM